MPRKPISQPSPAPSDSLPSLDPDFLKRKIQQLEMRTGKKPTAKIPEAGLEHYPGEGVLYGDWGLA